MPLIICPECNSKISDKAAMCVHCGCPREFFNSEPNNAVTTIQKAVKKPVKRTKMKMPNGYGHIKHLGGNRRKPYAAYPPRRKTDYDDNGKELPIKALGYFKTRAQAETCLFEYRVMHNNDNSVGFTFADIYERWLQEYETKNKSPQSLVSYSAAYKNVECLHNVPITSIYKDELQKTLDSCELGISSLKNIKSLYNQMFKYCISNNIVQTNYAQYVEIKKEDDTVSGEPLTEEELKIYWKHKDDREVFQIALILIYTGLRVTELKVVEIDLKEKTLKGGLKNKHSKNRIVPIHPAIYEFVKNFDQQKYQSSTWRNKLYKALEKENLAYTKNGNKRTPHDFRHTFSWLADKYKIDDMSKHMLLGHLKGKDVESNTYGHRTLDELRTEMEKIIVPNL